MKLLYSFISIPGEGGSVHIENFIKAYRKIGGSLATNALVKPQYMGDKDSWSLARKLSVKLRWIRVNVTIALKTLKEARRARADVLVFRFDPMHEFFLTIALLYPFWPIVLEVNAVRSLENHQNRPRISDLLDSFSLKRACRVVVVSQRVKEHLIETYALPQEKLMVIENGVDPAEFDPSIDGDEIRKKLGLDDSFVYCFVGSFRPWHGVGQLLAVVERFSEMREKTCLVLIGDGPERSQYEERAREALQSGHVRFVGRVSHSEVPKYLSAADVLIAPVEKRSFAGEFHGSPLKLFEYMAMAKPVIASPLGQTKEVIEDGTSGLLVDCEDVEVLAHTLAGLYDNPHRRKQLGESARQRILERYTWDINAQKVRAACKAARA